MKTKFIEKIMNYNGSQLRPLYAYENHKVLGDSIISWVGSCDVTPEHMVDYEDKIAQEKIQADQMLHFIIEIFDANLLSAVAVQRLLASIVKDQLQLESPKNNFIREGDDIYWIKKKTKHKFSISIASRSCVSIQIHFAVNATNVGTPVKTCALSDFKIEPKYFSKKILNHFSEEYHSMREATQKVKPLVASN